MNTHGLCKDMRQLKELLASIPLSLVSFCLVIAGLLTGCQIAPGPWVGPAQSTPGVTRPTASPAPPIDYNVFTLPPPHEHVMGRLQSIKARPDDTLADIARRHGLGYNQLVEANPDVDPWLPGGGTSITLPTEFVLPDAPRQGIVINVAAMRLFYYPANKPGQPPRVMTFPVGIGRVNWATPLGQTQVISKVRNPAWYVPASVRHEHAQNGDPLPEIVPPGPDNPLGGYAMRLSMPGYLIHGTNKPYGIGMRVSHGCVRLYPKDIVELFDRVPVETPVEIVNQPYLIGWREGMLYLEAHRPLQPEGAHRPNRQEQLLGMVMGRVGPIQDAIDWERVARLVRLARGFPVPILVRSPQLEDIVAKAPAVLPR